MDNDQALDTAPERQRSEATHSTPPKPPTPRGPVGPPDGGGNGDGSDGEAPGRRLEHDGRFGEIFVLFLRNLALSIITLGIYRFWGKTRIRRYLWSHTSFDGERLEYGGTGLELFLGFLLALVFLIPAIGGVQLLQSMYPNDVTLLIASTAVLYLVLLYLYGVAVFSAHRYKMSRTVWRGIRGGVTGSAWTYGTRFFLYLLLSLITLGWSSPFEKVNLWRYMLNNSHLGNRPLEFTGKGRDLLRIYAICWVFYVWSFTLSMVWYRAAALRYLAQNTRYENLRFKTGITGERLFEFYLVNLGLMIITLGFAWPYVALRHARLLAEQLEVIGDPDYQRILQSQEQAPRTGEGLADFLDVGGI